MPTLRTMFAAVLATAALLYGSATAYMYAKQDSLIFPQTINQINPKNVVATPTTMTMSDGTLLQGAIVNAAASQKPSPTVVLLFGGNAHDVAGFVNFWGTDILPPHSNVIVLGMAYRGYPTFLTPPSQGTPSQQAIESDAREMPAKLQSWYGPHRLVLVGYSLGTAVAARLAYQLEQQGTPADYLVLVSPFTSMASLAKQQYGFLPVDALLKHPFKTESFFADIRQTPILLVSTPSDSIVPASQTAHLKQLNPGADLVSLPGTTHGDILNHRQLPPLLRHAAGL